MDYAVVEFGKFGLVPAVGGSYKISGDALQFVNVAASAFRTNFEFALCVFISAVHASVAVVVYRAIADVVAVHELYYVTYGLGIVCGVTVDLDIENVSAACQVVIWSLDHSFMAWRAVVVDGNMV